MPWSYWKGNAGLFQIQASQEQKEAAHSKSLQASIKKVK